MATFGDSTVNTLALALEFSVGAGNETVSYTVPGGRRAKVKLQKILMQIVSAATGNCDIVIGEAKVRLTAADNEKIKYNLLLGLTYESDGGATAIDDGVVTPLTADLSTINLSQEIHLSAGQTISMVWNSAGIRPTGANGYGIFGTIEEYTA
jgi:hypothetical protein